MKFPAEWRFCMIRKGSKAPIGFEWEKRPMLGVDAYAAYAEGWFKAPSRNKETGEVSEKNFPVGGIGVFCGVASGGLLMLDHDGDSCDALLEKWGELPETWMVTSGRPGHYQLAFKVPEQYWSTIDFYKETTGTIDSEGKHEQVEFRWADGVKGIQSVIYGTHPDTGNEYTWLDTDKPIATAPMWMIEKMLKPQKTERHHEPPSKTQHINDRWGDREWAVSYLDAIDPSHLDWYVWRKCLFGAHIAGLTESEARQWSNRSPKHTDEGFGDVWRHIKDDKNNNAGLAALGTLAKQNGWKTPFKPGENHQASKPTLTEAIAAVTAQNVDVTEGLHAALDQIDAFDIQYDNDVELNWAVTNFAHDAGLAARGFKGEKLLSLARARRDNQANLVFEDAIDLLYSTEEVDFLVGGLIVRGCVGVTVAPGGSGKTTLFYDIAHAMATGAQWSGYPTVQGRVLIVQTDEPKVNIRQKMLTQQWQNVEHGAVTFLRRWRFTQFRGLEKKIREEGYDLVIIDSWTAAHAGTGVDLTKSNAGDNAYLLRDLAADAGCAIEVLHHANKEGGLRDSSALADNVSEVRFLKPAPVEKGFMKSQRLLDISKSRSDLMDTYLLEQTPDYSWVHLGLVSSPDDPTAENSINRISTQIRRDRQKVTPWQVAQQHNISPDRAKADLQRLVRWGLAKEEWTIGTNTDGSKQGYFVYYAA